MKFLMHGSIVFDTLFLNSVVRRAPGQHGICVSVLMLLLLLMLFVSHDFFCYLSLWRELGGRLSLRLSLLLEHLIPAQPIQLVLVMCS